MSAPMVKVYAGYQDLLEREDLDWEYYGPGWWMSRAGVADKPRTHTLIARIHVGLGKDQPKDYVFFLHVHTAHKLDRGKLPMVLGAFFEPGRPAAMSGPQFAANEHADRRVLNAVREKFTQKFLDAVEVHVSKVDTDKAPPPKKSASAPVKAEDEDGDWGRGFGGGGGGGGGDAWDSGEPGSGSASSSSAVPSKPALKPASKVPAKVSAGDEQPPEVDDWEAAAKEGQ